MVKFTAHEVRDIIISMLVIAGAFAYIFSGRNINIFFYLIPITLVSVGLGFVIHELSHKFVAVHYGFYAEYRMWVQGLILALVTAYFGFVFAAPGAVYIHGEYISREENGKISLAGPMTNVILAFIFLGVAFLFPSPSILYVMGILGFTVNSFLALFNLLPVSVFDGAKVFKWNPVIWGLSAGLSLLMVAYSMLGSFM
ncbi:MAG: site-2 protease family protein [Methanobacteriaceae archaeon]|nr:site-2 protease family protein [Methanobacteriaceae archaeon]